MFDDLYLYFLLMGVTIGLVLLALWRQARRMSRISLALIRLNEELGFDTLAFLPQSWPLLAEAGLRGMTWQVDWFGTPARGNAGDITPHMDARLLRAGEIALDLRLYRDGHRGEQRFLSDSLIETYLLLLRMDISIKSGASDAAFAQVAKLNTFVQHDIKNIAQFIQLLADQLANVPPGKEVQMLAQLGKAAPLVRQRADRIVQTLSNHQRVAGGVSRVDLSALLSRLCGLHGLSYQILGTATVLTPANLLDSALDNILKNYADIAAAQPELRPTLQIRLEEIEGSARLEISASRMPPVFAVERLFEPFWTQRPGGLGIGLYQARHMVEACGGTLNARTDAAGSLQFYLVLPQAAEAEKLAIQRAGATNPMV